MFQTFFTSSNVHVGLTHSVCPQGYGKDSSLYNLYGKKDWELDL